MRTTIRYKPVSWLWWIGVPLIIWVFALWIGSPPKPTKPFDSQVWNSNGLDTGSTKRLEYIEDLLWFRIRRGQTRQQVRQLLGTPENPQDAPSQDLLDGKVHAEDTYYLGERPGRLDDTYLFIQYDADYRVVWAGLVEG